jgi:acetylornithine aminotransferase
MTERLMHTYARLPVAFERGEGPWLWSSDGRRYFDALSGIAVCGLGHSHPAVTRAIQDQAGRLLHTSNLYRIPVQERLAERLCANSRMDAAFFCNSGAEANEAAIKLARLWGHRRGVSQPLIVVAEGAFHGRTLATLTATGNRRAQAGFEPLMPGFARVPFGEISALETVANNCVGTVAIMLEPIQGEGGIRLAPAGYLSAVRKLCDQRGWLMILDEVQSGICRSGHWLASQGDGVLPDVITLAKGLGNGIPIGACLARGEVANVFEPGHHGSTFGGNLLACAAANAVLDVCEADKLCERAGTLGERLLAGFRERLGDLPGLVEVRGRGLLIGIELDRPCAELVRRALESNLLLNVTAGNVVRLLPPLIVSDDDAEHLLASVSTLIGTYLGTSAPEV